MANFIRNVFHQMHRNYLPLLSARHAPSPARSENPSPLLFRIFRFLESGFPSLLPLSNPNSSSLRSCNELLSYGCFKFHPSLVIVLCSHLSNLLPLSEFPPLFFSSLAPFRQTLAMNVQLRFEGGLRSNLDEERKGEREGVEGCWACAYEAPPGAFLLCPSCNSVQPLNPNVDYFEILNVEKRYDLDLKELEKTYKALQKKVHPDLFGSKSERERQYSAEQSAQIIKAYHTLLQPLSRATYMLQIQGINVEEEGTVEDAALLMEIMEMQEAVEATTDVTKLQTLMSKAKSKISDCEKFLVDAFKEKNLLAAKTSQQEMSYYNRVCGTILKRL